MIKKPALWLLAIPAVLALLADLGGAYTTIAATLTAVLSTTISLAWIVGLIMLFVLSLLIIQRFTRGARRDATDVVSIANQGQFFEAIQRQIATAQNDLLVVGLEKDWVFPLAVSVAMARTRGRAVAVIYFQEFHQRYRLLEYLGCTVARVDTTTERGRVAAVFSDANNILSCRATVRTARQSEAVFGRHYFCALDFPLISNSYRHILSFINQDGGQSEAGVTFVPEFIQVPDQDLIDRLKGVVLYREATISLESVDIKDTVPTSSFVVRFKLSQVQDVIRLHNQKGWALFHPCAITLSNGGKSLVVPPVLEEHDGRLFVMEGHTRLFALHQSGVKAVRAVVVRKVDAPLPLTPTRWQKVTIEDEKNERRDPTLARYIETAAHRGVWGE